MPGGPADAATDSIVRSAALFDRAPFPIFLIDAETKRIVDANRSACELYGYTPEEMRERTNADMSAEPGRTAAAVDRRLEKVPVRFHRKKDGTVFPVEISATYFNEGDRVIHVAFIHDISDRVHLEDREQDLWRQIRHLARLSDLGTLASSLAHDLAQPMTAVMNYASAIINMAAANRLDSEKVAQVADRIREQAKNASGIIKGIRTMIARDDGEAAPCDLDELIGTVAELFEGEAHAHAVRVDVAPNAGVPKVMANAVQVRQVLVNLIQNSIDALAASAVAPRVVTVSTAADGNGMVAVTVADTGPGVAPEMLEALFTPFRTTKANGMGVGLHIARKIVEAHGGGITAEGSPRSGAAFTFTLPAAG